MNSPIEIYRHHTKISKYLHKKGVILFWTQIHVAPSAFEHQTPYFVGIIQFDDGEKMPLELVECEEEPTLNQKVQTVLRRIGKSTPDGVILYGLKARVL